jgi:hypothetical protein
MDIRHRYEKVPIGKVHMKGCSSACGGGCGEIQARGRGGRPHATRPRGNEAHAREDPLEAQAWLVVEQNNNGRCSWNGSAFGEIRGERGFGIFGLTFYRRQGGQGGVDTSLEADPATAGDVVHQQHRGTGWRTDSCVRASVAGCCGWPAPRLALFSTGVLMSSFCMANCCLRLTG